VTGAAPRLKVAWVTNYAAPYRLPVWEALGESVELTIYTLATEAQFAKGGHNRASEWMNVTARGFAIQPVRTRSWRRGEATHYRASRSDIAQWIDADAVVIGGWDSPAYLAAARRARRKGVPVIAFYESVRASHRFTAGPIARVRRRFFERADAIVTPGAGATDAIRAMTPNAARIFEGFNAVDVEWIQRSTAAARAGRTARVGHHFLYLGQFVERKNLLAAVGAFLAIASPDDTFTLVGSGELADTLRAVGDPRVLVRTPVAYAHLPELLAQFGTLVLPSTDEVWGLVVNEALAAGLHAVVSSTAGVAPSVAGMAGVYIADATQAAIAGGLAASRAGWHGPIDSPAILEHTPRQFAAVFFAAIKYGIARG